jgi:hypothetical protein
MLCQLCRAKVPGYSWKGALGIKSKAVLIELNNRGVEVTETEVWGELAV